MYMLQKMSYTRQYFRYFSRKSKRCFGKDVLKKCLWDVF